MKDIKDYEGLYAVSSCGRVWSYKSQKFLKPRRAGAGYYFVSLYKNGEGKEILIHRLVAEAYIPNPENLETVDHIDNNKENNCINNLQWLTHADNNKKAHNIKVKCIELNLEFPSQSEAARHFNCSVSNINNALRGKAHTACGYHWEYVKEEEINDQSNLYL